MFQPIYFSDNVSSSTPELNISGAADISVCSIMVEMTKLSGISYFDLQCALEGGAFSKLMCLES